MKFLSGLILAISISSCVTIRGKEDPKLISAKKYYENEAVESAKFLMGCNNVEATPKEMYYFFYGNIIKKGLDTREDAALFPLSFKVAGCDKRVILLLVKSDRKDICTSPYDYTQQTCVFIQDSSFVDGKKQ